MSRLGGQLVVVVVLVCMVVTQRVAAPGSSHPSRHQPHPSQHQPHPSQHQPHPTQYQPHPSHHQPHPSHHPPHPSHHLHHHRDPARGNEGANILILHPIYAGSHELTLRRFGEDLVKRGHRITQIRWRSSKTQEVNTTVDVITLSADNRDLRYPYMQPDGTFHPPTTMLWERPRHMWQIPTDVFRLIDAHCLTLLGDVQLIRRLRRANFSLALVDIIGNECSLALAHSLGLPVVGFWGFSFQGGESRAAGVFQSPALVPNLLSEVGATMTFLERVWNTVVLLAETVVITYHFSLIDSHIKRLVPGCPGSRDLLRDMEVILVHSHWFIDYPKLMPPHVQYIGCIQCGPPASLPHEIDRWVSEAESGVVVFSLGYTGYEATTVPEHVMDAFITAFARLEQRVLVRFNAALLLYVPDNVMVVDWFPQHDVLGHPNTVLFVTHCGQNGVNEAVYHGVPIVALPVFADQGDNARRVVDRGLGLMIHKEAITHDLAYTTITTVLNHTRYRKTAARFSAQWKEEESGAERASRWVERVHRHGPLTHLRMPGAHLSFSQYFALDVAAFLLLLGFISCYLAYCLAYCLYSTTSSFTRRWKKEKMQ
ncbi:UDP-glucuronosyltransferase 1A9-like [Homarus americanus]|uniref:UDP-glucuronosyltransferase 1A9-like n=1 Tax=Homarus americanus TaxID=6706 RepID=UPI001C47180E|nr:UDP-glucuronosyltransferase 1A9-like [Homarus americanus]XP_042212021.1 UDP-glucuronosyltransferase 1A9-like [Homarus americanus]XP_042212023.1 UDP-glucuronosyltransferase 1A9-like [Homarus americanus]XP_042212024.1 UDP-glucuronosyltransferase 1A9-like [Homarus americanus]XP_042212025.1 UDP-glucuronosyltransferase 1A9-like [Homarus americanus]XP_042212026.1 UDP-glucuronosyltransferase 1A9-like [Homarus americanus]XP_042212027.1 UDP-glucuronosyltransferase 1A9-like [Homarus americanus]XP_0